MSRRPFRLWTGASLRPLESSSCKVVCADPSDLPPGLPRGVATRYPRPGSRGDVSPFAGRPLRHGVMLRHYHPTQQSGDVDGSVGLLVGDADHALLLRWKSLPT